MSYNWVTKTERPKWQERQEKCVCYTKKNGVPVILIVFQP